MENSKIEWTAHHLPDGTVVPGYTANFWWGCTHKSTGCIHCYAETWSKRMGKNLWGPTAPRERMKSIWKKLPQWNKEAAEKGYRPKVFTQSMSDLFEDHPMLPAWRQEALELMEQCTNLDFLALTKRPENIMDMVPLPWHTNWPKHIWAGTSTENQETADERVPYLLNVPAAVRFLSCEPLLGPLDLRGFQYPYSSNNPGLTMGHDWLTHEEKEDYGEKRLHWIIAGGESGHKARPMHPAWVRELRDQCVKTGVAFHFKQWGEWIPSSHATPAMPSGHMAWPWATGKMENLSGDTTMMLCVGKNVTGRLLDGRTWDEFPSGGK